MTLETAMSKLENHPEIKGLVFGIIAEDSEFRLDAFAYVSEKQFEKEKEKFIKFRKFVLKEEKK